MTRTRLSISEQAELVGFNSDELLKLAEREFSHTDEVTEPFDPDYLSSTPYEIPDISSYEKRFYHKVSIIENKLRKNHISFEWLAEHEMFRVGKRRQAEDGKISDYFTYQYIAVYMETNEYAFGGWEEDRCVSTRISDVIESVKEWLHNNEPGLR